MVNHSAKHQTITFRPASLKKIITMEDFYKAVGLMGKFEEFGIVDIQQIWMNRGQDLELNDLCKSNARKSRKYKNMSDRHIETSIAMDWLCYSPVSVPYVPKNELWLWTKEDYHIAMDEYRQWLRENESEIQI